MHSDVKSSVICIVEKSSISREGRELEKWYKQSNYIVI